MLESARTERRLLRFGVFELDLDAGELRKSGMRMKLGGQPYQLLVLLLTRVGEVVSREEMRRHLWPDNTFVDYEHALKKAINRLRDVLGDSAESPRYIEAIPRQGYPFIADVQGSLKPEPRPLRILELQAVPDPALPPKVRFTNASLVWVSAILGLGFFLLCGWLIIVGQHRVNAPLLERRLTANPEQLPVVAAVISPDGRYLAYADPAGIYIKEIGNGQTHPLQTPGHFRVIPNSWFPDGASLLVSSAPETNERCALWKLSIFGGASQKLMDDAFMGAVSPDGIRIVFLRGGPDYTRWGHEVWIMAMNGEDAYPVARQGPELDADQKQVAGWGSWFTSVTWSPTGRQIAYTHLVPGPEEGRVVLETRTAAKGGQARTVISDVNLQPAIYWMSDGRLLYSTQGKPGQDEPAFWSAMADPDRGVLRGEPHRLALVGGVWDIRATADSGKLMLLRAEDAFQVFISERLDADQWSPLRRLSLDQHSTMPWAWTPDSKSVLLTSDRNGKSQVFRQEIDKPGAELVATSSRQIRIVRMMPDGKSILCSEMASPLPSGRIHLVKYSLAGGPPEELLAEIGINNFQCARSPSTICVFDEPVGKNMTLFAYDTATGSRRKIGTVTDDPYGTDWDLSPDGSRIVAMLPDNAYRFYEMVTGETFEVTVKGWRGLHTVMWSPDSKKIFSGASTPEGSTALLEIDMGGNARQALVAPENIPLAWSIPSPDGRYQAIMAAIGENNVYLVENF